MQVKRKYYCLVAGLQDITPDIQKLIYNQLSFRTELEAELHPGDYSLVRCLFLPHDNKNLLNVLEKSGNEHLEKGNFSRDELEEGIREPASLPVYMQRFMHAYREKTPLFPDLSPENELTTLFYDEMAGHRNDFIRNWFGFDLNIKNIATALLARKHGFSYENQIIGTGEISETIRRSHARDFGLGSELFYMEELSNIAKTDDPQEREWALDLMRWEYLDETIFFEYFTIERILAFVIKLGMVERWLSINKEQGGELFRKLLAELKASYSLPESFTEK